VTAITVRRGRHLTAVEWPRVASVEPDRAASARTFYCTYGVIVVIAVAVVLIPGAPLVPILFLTQALNAILLPPLLILMARMARDPHLMGPYRCGRVVAGAYAVTIGVVVACVGALAVLTVM